MPAAVMPQRWVRARPDAPPRAASYVRCMATSHDIHATSLEIAQAAEPRDIVDVAADLGLAPDELEPYGRFKAKIPLAALESRAGVAQGRLVCVTAITPTPAGEGKTTTAIALTDALWRIGERAVLCLREPSLGPVFGAKGGAAGGGRAQLVPMEEINLHFTGDIHAIGAANNLLAAMLESHLLHGNELNIDAATITWRRCVDMDDRALRSIVVGLGGAKNGVPRETGFDITAASEVMAVLSVADDLMDLRRRLGAITVGETHDGRPVTADDLDAAGAMTVLLKDALKPNLVQTLEGRPALVHCGPFANIALGTSSLVGDRLGLALADFVVTESGFGADMGFEKFADIACRNGGLEPAAVVIVATVKALRHHGGGSLDAGAANLAHHIRIVRRLGWPPVVALNAFDDDDPVDLHRVRAAGARRGSRGGRDLRRLPPGRDRRAGARGGGARRGDPSRNRRFLSTRSTRRSSRSSPRSRRARTAQTASSSRHRRSETSPRSSPAASTPCRSAWRRRRSRCRTIPSWPEFRAATRFRSAACARTPARAGSSRSAATC